MFALDPLLAGKLTWAVFGIVALKVVVSFVVLLVATMFMVWFERKVIAGMQNRIGPNKAGPFGLLQTLADGTKLFFKEDLLPERADKFVFRFAPFLSFVPAFLAFCIIPVGGNFTHGNGGRVIWWGHATLLQVADPPIGMLLGLALSSIAVYGIMLAGWSSGSKYPLLGSVRASAQMVSYEAALGLSVATVFLMAGTMSTNGIVIGQGSLRNWNIVATGVVPFVIFLIAATAELNRPPFDLVEAEQELVGGFNTEYSSIRFALFFLAEFMNTMTMSAIIVTLFLGGPQPVTVGHTTLNLHLGPFTGTVWFLAKVLIFLYIYIWFRATLPRLRYDQLMDLGWKLLIPVSLAWFMALAGLKVAQNAGWSGGRQAGAMVVGAVFLILCYVLLRLAVRVSARTRAEEGAMF
jgi:NADH-quinone oxidoreductase subunit H